MRDFWIEPVAQTEFEEAAVWYESQRDGLGHELIAAVERIAHEPEFTRRRSKSSLVESCDESSSIASRMS